MNYYKEIIPGEGWSNQILTHPESVDDFKKYMFEAISNHPLTKDRVNFEETYELVKGIKEYQKYVEFDVKGQTLSVFWGKDIDYKYDDTL